MKNWKRFSACPFCHETDADMCHEDNGKWRVLCLNCFATGPENDYEDGAEYAWNEGTSR